MGDEMLIGPILCSPCADEQSYSKLVETVAIPCPEEDFWLRLSLSTGILSSASFAVFPEPSGVG